MLNQSTNLSSTQAPFPAVTFLLALQGENGHPVKHLAGWIVSNLVPAKGPPDPSFREPALAALQENSQSLQHFILTPMLVNSTPVFLVKDLQELVAGKKSKSSFHNLPSSWAPILHFLKVLNEWYRNRGKEAKRIQGTKMDSGLVAVSCN